MTFNVTMGPGVLVQGLSYALASTLYERAKQAKLDAALWCPGELIRRTWGVRYASETPRHGRTRP